MTKHSASQEWFSLVIKDKDLAEKILQVKLPAESAVMLVYHFPV